MIAQQILQEAIDLGFSYGAAQKIAAKAIADARKIDRIEKKRKAIKSLKYNDFLKQVTPNFDWTRPHATFLSDIVDRVVAGKLKRVAISISPRVGKSETITKRLPAYWLERDPTAKIVLAAYNTTLAEEFSETALEIYRGRNPGTLASENVGFWKLATGGSCYAVGAGSGLTGHGLNLGIIDDPTKNILEAFSITYQNRVWNWFNTDFMTRRNNLADTPIMVIAARWHSRDLIGRLKTSEDSHEWEFISIPAIARENDPLGRIPGESIWEERMPIVELLKDKRRMGLMFNALYDQDPIDTSNGTFRTEKLEIIKEVPRQAHRVRYFDKAATEGAGDWTVGVLMAYDDSGLIYVEHVVRGQWDRDGVRQVMRQTIIADNALYGNIEGYTYSFVFEREPGGDGKSVAIDLVRWLAPYASEWNDPIDNKSARAGGYASQVNAGNVKIKEADWNQDYIGELATFVAGINNRVDDQVDGSSGAFNKLVIENLEFSVR